MRQGFDSSPPILVILCSGIVHFVYWYLLAKALQKGDLTLVYPIMRSSPVLVLIFSIVILDEDLSLLGIAGILIVVVGVYGININRLALSEIVRPFRALRRDQATQFALLTMISVAGYTLVDKIAVGQMHPVLFAYLYPWLSLGLFSGYLFKVKPRGVLALEWRQHKGAILACGVLSIFGYLLILVAFTLERMSYVAGLRQLSIVFAVCLGGQLLKEKNKLIRITSAIIIFAGTYLIAIAD
jgi:drug/metabolite transporter (DMT)-like permease